MIVSTMHIMRCLIILLVDQYWLNYITEDRTALLIIQRLEVFEPKYIPLVSATARPNLLKSDALMYQDLLEPFGKIFIP